MEIIHSEKKKCFDLFDDAGNQIGTIEYMPGGGNDIYATHTLVSPEYGGQGYAGQLLKALVGFARENGLTIVPLCGYVAGEFKKHPDEYADVMKKSR